MPLRASAAERPASPPCTPEVVRPEEGARRTQLVAWIKAHMKTVVGKKDPDAADLLDGDPPPIDQADVRFADLDNDGGEEALITRPEGSMGFLSTWLFAREGDGWTFVQDSPLVALFEGAQDFIAPDVPGAPGESRLVVRLCGTTYVSLAGGRGGADHYPDTYVWRGGTAIHACDTPWLRYQRRVFQALFDAKHYDDAHGYLDGVQAQCASAADPETWLWMQSDLALTAFRMQTYKDCRDHVDAAEKSAAIAHASDGVRRALAANRRLCPEGAPKASTGPRTRDAFGWLRA